MRIAVATLYSGEDCQRMAAISNPAKQEYCQRFGYEFVGLNHLPDPGRHPAWNKIPFLRETLPRFDWVFWCDVDTVFWNSDIGLLRFVTNVDDHICFIAQENHQGLNTGVFFLRNHPWSIEFLDAIYAQRQFDTDPWREQAAIIHLLQEDQWRSASLIYPHGQPEGGFHGYWYFDDWDKLLLHFAGLESGQRIGLMENLARLAKYPRHLRLLHRDQLGDLLNRLGLLGEGAEVGVSSGEFSRTILDRWEGRKLHLVDPWRHLEGYTDISNLSDEECKGQMESALHRTTPHRDRTAVHRMLSLEAAHRFSDETLDFVYIDAAHHYEAVAADVAAWYPKVRRGGVLAGHDFLDGELPQGRFGVKRAVTELERAIGTPVAVTAEQHWPSWYLIKGSDHGRERA